MARQMPSQGGNIPQRALERLGMMRGDATHHGFFTSDLSVNELLLVREAGFDPVGMVVGNSIYHIGYQRANWNQNQEMGMLSQAMYHARQLAMTRMEEEAYTLGADGVVGVRLEISTYSWADELAEFMVVGTAVRSRNGRSYRNARGMPFTSDLSGQDFWTLLRAGYMPVGLVMGTCVYHVAYQSLGQWLKQVGQNAEMTNFTQALYEARELAMARMQGEMLNLNAQGIVGTIIREQSFGWEPHIIEFFAMGTAVVPIEGVTPSAPSMTVPLTDAN